MTQFIQSSTFEIITTVASIVGMFGLIRLADKIWEDRRLRKARLNGALPSPSPSSDPARTAHPDSQLDLR